MQRRLTVFDKVSRLAERTAVGVSRCAFFGWVGRGALSLAARVGSVGWPRRKTGLASSMEAAAAVVGPIKESGLTVLVLPVAWTRRVGPISAPCVFITPAATEPGVARAENAVTVAASPAAAHAVKCQVFARWILRRCHPRVCLTLQAEKLHGPCYSCPGRGLPYPPGVKLHSPGSQSARWDSGGIGG